METKIRELYFNSPAGFSTANRLYKYMVAKGYPVSRNAIKEVLAGLDTYTLHQRKYKNKRNPDKVVVTGPQHLYQADLAFLTKFGHYIGFLIV